MNSSITPSQTTFPSTSKPSKADAELGMFPVSPSQTIHQGHFVYQLWIADDGRILIYTTKDESGGKYKMFLINPNEPTSLKTGTLSIATNSGDTESLPHIWGLVLIPILLILSLHPICLTILGFWSRFTRRKLITKTNQAEQNDKEFGGVSDEQFWQYNCKDAACTLEVAYGIMSDLQECGMYGVTDSVRLPI